MQYPQYPIDGLEPISTPYLGDVEKDWNQGQPKRNIVSRATRWLHHTIYNAFYSLGCFAVARPWTLILLSLLLAILCGLGWLRFDTEENPESLFTPQDSQANVDQDYVEATWGRDEPTDVLVYLTPITGTQVLVKDIINCLYDINNVIVGTTATYEGETPGSFFHLLAFPSILLSQGAIGT